MILKIRKTTDPFLRQPCEEVRDFDHELQFLIDNMIETMRKDNGIGLAAPQVGVSKKIFICEFEGDKEAGLDPIPLTVVCNPKITFFSEEKRSMVEGCLSFPGLELLIKRPEKIKISGQDRFGKNIEIEASSIYARVMQHEADHLSSTLFIDHIKETRVLFIGTGTLGTKALLAMSSDPQYKIVGVVVGKQKKVTSRKEVEESQILKIAKKNKLNIIETENINDQKIVDTIKELKPELGIMADFGQIIKKEILDIPKYGIINIHPSLLPKYRGPSPIQQAILDGEKLTGVTLILTSEKMDAGGTIAKTEVELLQSETATILKDFLAEVAATLLLNALPYYLAEDLQPKPQDESQATYTKLFKKEDGEVFEKTTGIEVERKIRAFEEWPKVFIVVNGKRVQLTAGHLDAEGHFVLDRVKPEGKNEMNYSDYLNGHGSKLTFS